MSQRKFGALIFAVATLGLGYVKSSHESPIIGLILVILWFVLLGYLVERGLLPEAVWPFQRRIDLLDLALSAACLTASLAFALAIVLLRNDRIAVLVMGAVDVLLIGGGLFFYTRGVFFGPKR